MPSDRLGDLLKSFEDEEERLRIQIDEICYHMGGGVEMNTAWGMSFRDREILIKVINKKLKEKAPSGKEYL